MPPIRIKAEFLLPFDISLAKVSSGSNGPECRATLFSNKRGLLLMPKVTEDSVLPNSFVLSTP